MSSRSSSACSFERFDSENEMTWSVSDTEAPQVDEVQEIDEVEDKVAKLEQEKKELEEKLAEMTLCYRKKFIHACLLGEENMARAKDAKSSILEHSRAFPLSKEGKWKFESSSDLDAFIRRRRAVATPTDLDDVLLHVAEQNIAFRDHYAQLFESVGVMKFNEKSVRFSGISYSEGCAETSFIAGGVMKTRRVQMGVTNGVKGYEEERFVKDGKLHVVTRMHGESITRVFSQRQHVTDICGHWRQIGKPDRSISLNLKNGVFYRKTMNDDQKEKDASEQFRIDATDRGWETRVEGQMLVQEQYTDGSLSMVRKRFVEDGKLVSLQEQPGKSDERWTFERVGKPLTP